MYNSTLLNIIMNKVEMHTDFALVEYQLKFIELMGSIPSIHTKYIYIYIYTYIYIYIF